MAVISGKDNSFNNTILVVHKSFTNAKLKSDKVNFESGRFSLRANFKLISLAAYNNNIDIRIKLQFFSEF